MARNPPTQAVNYGVRQTKTESLRLSDVASRSTTDYAEIIVGDGVPSGGYGRDAGATLIYLRKDASSADTCVYVSQNGGTNWTANATGSSSVSVSQGNTWTATQVFSHATPIQLDVVAERTANAGVTVDGVLLKDNAVTASGGVTANVTGNCTGSSGSCTGNAATATTATTATNLLSDEFVKATITVPDVGGGGTAAALTLNLKRRDDSNIGSIRAVMITTSGTQYIPFDAGEPLVGSVTFSNATTGDITASGNGWALVRTNNTGAFACTANNTDDETVYFRVQTATAVGNLIDACVVLGSNSDPATWSA